MQRERQEGHLHVGVWDSLTHQPVPAAAGPSPEAALGHLLLGPPRLQTTFLPRERWHRPDRWAGNSEGGVKATGHHPLPSFKQGWTAADIDAARTAKETFCRGTTLSSEEESGLEPGCRGCQWRHLRLWNGMDENPNDATQQANGT